MSFLGCVTGRFQPVHRQHLSLFGIALEHCEHLVVAIANPDSSAWEAEPTSAHRHTQAANPLSYFERARLIEAALHAQGWRDRCTLVPFDIRRPELWPQYVPKHARQFVRAYSDWEREKARRLRDAGYPLDLIEGDVRAKLSASEIRECLRRGDPGWRAMVPAATVPLLEQLQPERFMDTRG